MNSLLPEVVELQKLYLDLLSSEYYTDYDESARLLITLRKLAHMMLEAHTEIDRLQDAFAEAEAKRLTAEKELAEYRSAERTAAETIAQNMETMRMERDELRARLAASELERAQAAQPDAGTEIRQVLANDTWRHGDEYLVLPSGKWAPIDPRDVGLPMHPTSIGRRRVRIPAQPDADAEKKTRIKYQSIVYDVCNLIDAALGLDVSRGEGTVIDEVVGRVRELISGKQQPDADAVLRELKADAERVFGEKCYLVRWSDIRSVIKGEHGNTFLEASSIANLRNDLTARLAARETPAEKLRRLVEEMVAGPATPERDYIADLRAIADEL